MVVGVVHLGSRSGSARFQLLFTGVKVLLIILFIVAAWWHVEELQVLRWTPDSSDLPLLGSGAFAIALIYVNYAYTGWNAATYLVGEVEGGGLHLPKILLLGTAVVMLIYVILHIMFLTVAPMQALQGKLEIGYVVAGFAFGDSGSALVGLMLAILLVSTVSAMVIAGPRALQVIGQDFSALRFLAYENKHGIPADADFVFDMRCLPNPYWDLNLRHLTGLDDEVIEFLDDQESVTTMHGDVLAFLERWIPQYQSSNRGFLTVAIGCTGGQHRSVFMAEKLAASLQESHGPVSTRHREL